MTIPTPPLSVSALSSSERATPPRAETMGKEGSSAGGISIGRGGSMDETTTNHNRIRSLPPDEKGEEERQKGSSGGGSRGGEAGGDGAVVSVSGISDEGENLIKFMGRSNFFSKNPAGYFPTFKSTGEP